MIVYLARNVFDGDSTEMSLEGVSAKSRAAWA